MTWWTWVLLWTALVVVAAVVLVRLGLLVWRAAGGLLTEVGRAGEVSAALSEQVTRLRAAEEREPVVATAFDDPVAMRRLRNQRLAQRTRARRRRSLRSRRSIAS